MHRHGASWLIMLVAMLFAFSPDPASAAGEKIAYAAELQGGLKIFTMNPDGSAQTTVIDNGFNPAISPDGKRIAFTSNQSRASRIYTAHIDDGSNLTQVTQDPLNGLRIDVSPTWSPDGSAIAFRSFYGSAGEAHISRTPLAASPFPPSDLTTTEALRGFSQFDSPTWSPDGEKIAFSAINGGNRDIYVLTLASGEVRGLTTDGAENRPEWSPDGKWIAFDSYRRTSSTSDIYAARADGSQIKQITNNIAYDTDPTWSPNGERIAFRSNRDNSQDIFAISFTGGENTRTNLTRTLNLHEIMPSWGSPKAGPPPVGPLNAGSECQGSRYTNTLEVRREIRLGDLVKGKGVKVYASASQASSASIGIEINGRQARQFKIYRKNSKEKSKVLAQTTTEEIDTTPRAIYIKATGRSAKLIRRALRMRQAPKRTKLKVKLVSQATANPRLERYNTQTIRALRRGNVKRSDRYSKYRHVAGKSQCGEPLVASITGPRELKLKNFVTKKLKPGKGIKAKVNCSHDCTARFGSRLWGRYETGGLKLRRVGSRSNRWISSREIKLRAGETRTVYLQGPRSRAQLKQLRNAVRTNPFDRVKAKFAIEAHTDDGRADADAKTVRVILSGKPSH